MDNVCNRCLFSIPSKATFNLVWPCLKVLVHVFNPELIDKSHSYSLKHYYSFKIFLRFWLVKTPRIIRHNQLLLTKYWTNDVKRMSKVQPAADYWTVDQENLGTKLCYFGERKNKERNDFFSLLVCSLESEVAKPAAFKEAHVRLEKHFEQLCWVPLQMRSK